MSTETRLNGNWISLVPGGGEGTGFRRSHRRPGYTDGARSGYPHRSDHSPMDVNRSWILLRSLSLRQFNTIYWDALEGPGRVWETVLCALETTKGGREKHETVTATGYLEEYITVVLNLRVKNCHCHGKWPSNVRGY